MADYKDRINYEDHDFNSTTVIINGEHKVEGLDSVTVEYENDEVGIQTVNDGTAIPVVNPRRNGTITIGFLEAGATTDVMYGLLETRTAFKVQIKDSVAPNLDCKGARCRVMKRPNIVRGAEATIAEWVLIVPYLDSKGGSYSLASA